MGRKSHADEASVSRPKLLILSHALPFPQSAGQSQRVRYTLEALRVRFHLTFATSAPAALINETRQKLLQTCDDVVIWKSQFDTTRLHKFGLRAAGVAYSIATGLKKSNFDIRREFSPAVLRANGLETGFDGVLLEYWHAMASLKVFQAKGIPCVVDLHNVLWQARLKELIDVGVPRRLSSLWAKRYRVREESAWNNSDAIITISRGEHEYIQTVASPKLRLFHAPMGIPLEMWPYSWEPDSPPKLMYYGGLASPHNQRDALDCLRKIMPRVWRDRPDVELWIVGSNPPAAFQKLQLDPRVKVTGFVARPQEVLSRATAVLCPWSGTYGFRSRLVEVMSLGTPVIASLEAAYGMELRPDHGFFPCADDQQMARCALGLIENADLARQHSYEARRQVEDLFSFENSYGRLAKELYEWVDARRSAKSTNSQRVVAHAQ
jgi:glycosyltransferase involved in cell wall biosynthesis